MAAQTHFMFAPVPQHPAELWKMSTDRIVSLLQTLVAMYEKGTERGVRLLGPHQAPPGPFSKSSHIVSLETSSVVFRASIEASGNADCIKVNLRFLFDPEVGWSTELEVPIIKARDWFPW